jgi:prepilin peptidase CpaA
MDAENLVYGLFGVLAIALLHAAYTDIKRREIENWLTAGIALAAPLFWWANGFSIWPDMAFQLALGLGVFIIFTGFFAIGAMGGGDVKLIAAIALWFAWQQLLMLVLVMSLVGGILTVVMAIDHRRRRRLGQPEIPYGVAITIAGLWTIWGSVNAIAGPWTTIS